MSAFLGLHVFAQVFGKKCNRRARFLKERERDFFFKINSYQEGRTRIGVNASQFVKSKVVLSLKHSQKTGDYNHKK